MKKIIIVLGAALCLAGAFFWFLSTEKQAEQTYDGERVYMEMVIEGEDVQGTVDILQKRLESFGVKNLRTESLDHNILIISFPPLDSIHCVRKLICTKGLLEFWPTFTADELYSSFIAADKIISEKFTEKSDRQLSDMIQRDYNHYARIGVVSQNDTAKVGEYLRIPEVKEIMGKDFIPAWSIYPAEEDAFELIGIRRPRENEKMLNSDEVEKAWVEFYEDSPEIRIEMTKKGGRIFGRITGENVGRQIAITIDGHVYMYPIVNERIDGGQCSIAGGQMTLYEVETTAALLNGGMLPAQVVITREWRDGGTDKK